MNLSSRVGTVVRRRHTRLLLNWVALFLAAWVATVPARAEISLQKIPNVQPEGAFQRIKPTVINDRGYSVMQFQSRIVMLDQNGFEVGARTFPTADLRAVAVDGAYVYVLGRRAAGNRYEVIKFRFDPLEQKFISLGGSVTQPALEAEFEANASDMCVADGKVWILTAHNGGALLTRWTAGVDNEAPKWDKVPGTLGTGYTDGGDHGWYRFKKSGSLVDYTPDGTRAYSVRLCADPDGKSFWFALLDGGSYGHIRLGQIVRKGEWELTCPKVNPGWGGFPLYGVNEGGIPQPRGLAVDSQHIYMACTSAVGLSKVYRVSRDVFGSPFGNVPAVNVTAGNVPAAPLVTAARIENATGVPGGTSGVCDLMAYKGRITVAGLYGNHGLKFKIGAKESTASAELLNFAGNSNLFVASITAAFDRWENAAGYPEAVGAPQPSFDFNQIGFCQATGDASTAILTARFLSGEAKFDGSTTYGGTGNTFALLVSASDNEPTGKQYTLKVEADGKLPDQKIDGKIEFGSGVGFSHPLTGNSKPSGQAVTVTAPPFIYQRADKTFLKQAEITEEAIQADNVVARYRPTGYTVTRSGDPQIESGADRSVTVVMTKDTNVAFHFVREYPLTIDSDLSKLGLTNTAAGKALGNPTPECKRHWFTEDDTVRASVDSWVTSSTDPGTRFLCTGYAKTPQSPTDPQTFTPDIQRASVKEFTMSGATKLVYSWKKQHSITMSASTSAANALLATKAGTAVTRFSTVPVQWFDSDTEVSVGATFNTASDLSPIGVMFASGALDSMNDKLVQEFTPNLFSDGGSNFRGKTVRLNKSGTATWNFGNTIYRQIVTLGSPVNVGPGFDPFEVNELLTDAKAATIRTDVAPTVLSLLDVPTGTTTTNAFKWSPIDRKMYPVRPGRCLLEWSLVGSGKLTMEVTAGFAGDTVRHPSFVKAAITRSFPGPLRHLRALVHPAMPPIDLDPSDQDEMAFAEVVYSAGLDESVGTNTESYAALTGPRVPPLVAENELTFPITDGELAGADGKHVLVFTRRAGGAATGDRDSEPLVVRVLETRRWNATVPSTGGTTARRLWEDQARSPSPKSLSFAGTNGTAVTGLTDLSGNALTIQFWFNGPTFSSVVRQQLNNDYVIAGWGGERRLVVSAQNDPLGSGAIRMPATVTDGNWHLVTMTWERNKVGGFRGYLDGVLQDTPKDTPDRPIPKIASPLFLGSAFATTEWAKGSLDELSIWNRALGEQEIKAYVAKAYPTGAEPGLQAYWTFDGDSVTDQSGHGYNGKLLGPSGGVTYGAQGVQLVAPSSADPDGSAIVGKRIVDDYDTAGIGTGFVTGSRARYNVDFHDNTKVADAGPIFPVNRQFTGLADDAMEIVWYERRDNVLWPWRPRKYDVQWPTDFGRIVVASQLGSDGVSFKAANNSYRAQPRFDSASVTGLRIYTQNDPLLPGFNPNEEHAVVTGSLKASSAGGQAQAVFALRNDLNVVRKSDAKPGDLTPNYTSDPYVLAEFTSTATGQPDMRVYKVELEDTSLIDPGYRTFDTRTGGVVVRNGQVGLTTPQPLLPDEPIAIQILTGSIAGVSSGQTYYAKGDGVMTEVAISAGPGGDSIKSAASDLGSVSLRITRLYPYVFNYRATAGRPVPLPYPLETVVGPNPPAETSGGEPGVYSNAAQPVQKVYYEDYKGVPWAISGGPPGTSGGAAFFTRFFYRMQPGFWHKRKADGLVAGAADNGFQSALGDPIAWLPTDGAGRTPRTIAYASFWPASAPILKVGETLTFSGGEYQADNPASEGLPGVLGWAAGRVVFDALNPSMDKDAAADAADAQRNVIRQRTFLNYSARLVSPLEPRVVDLAAIGWDALRIATFKSKIAPATGIVEVDGAVWRFKNLPASLRARLSFDPIGNRLILVGYVNDKTLGDDTLTAAPPPAYLLEPNILSPIDHAVLRNFKANPAEDETLDTIVGTDWVLAADALARLTFDPQTLRNAPPELQLPQGGYYAGLDWAPQRSAIDIYRYGTGGTLPAGAVSGEVPAGIRAVEGQPVPSKYRAHPASLLGPGLALVPSPLLLDPNPADEATRSIIRNQFEPDDRGLYVTLAENDDASLGLPVSMHVVRIMRKHRYRGAIKLVEGDNVFSEKVTLRHTGDFGGNTGDLRFEWFYRPDDGRTVAMPYAQSTSIGPWQLFAGATGPQVDFNSAGLYVLPDLWFVARYGHKNDTTVAGTSWSSSEWAQVGKPDPKKGELWAGAANSPQSDGTYIPQLIPGWLKRVTDRINPYEARFNDFRNNSAPATYASMIQEAGPSYNGPVALNPDKNVIENTGLIQLYSTLLARAKKLGLQNEIPDEALSAGVMNAIQLAATRLQDLYMVLGNEAYSDSQDPLIGFGSNSASYGSGAASMWTFMNQTANPLDEELALLRGGSFSFGRPVYNRLFWNFTKDLGEVAYAQTYNINDENNDGFIDEKDAMILYPMGHGDAWGHYSTAVKMHYDLLAKIADPADPLKPNYFTWQPRSEYANLLDVVVPIDYYDERKFAFAAASRAKAGADVVSLTYRQRYTENPEGQWQGYGDTDSDRAWGVQEWARRAGQAAFLDWAVANSLLPAEAENRGAAMALGSATTTDGGKSYSLFNLNPSLFVKADGNGNPVQYLLTVTVAPGTTKEAILQPGSDSRSDTLSVPNVVERSAYLTVRFADPEAFPGLTATNFSLAVLDRPQGIQKVDRTTVESLDSIAREYRRIESTVADADAGLNPLGLARDAVPFDIDPAQYAGRNGVQPVSHFEQVYERARRAVVNARTIFDSSTEALNAIRQNQDSRENFAKDVSDRDRELRNRLIEIFGTPHSGNIGTGKPYPAGYLGPDLFFNAYVDVNDVSAVSIPPTSAAGTDGFYQTIKGFAQELKLTSSSKWVDRVDLDYSDDYEDYFENVVQKLFLSDYGDFAENNAKVLELRNVSVIDNSPIQLRLPVRAKGYAFAVDPAWGWGTRSQTGELQTMISQLVQAEADLALAVADYNHYLAEIDSAAGEIAARQASALRQLDTLIEERGVTLGLAITRALTESAAIIARNVSERTQEALQATLEVTPTTVIAGTAAGGDVLRSARVAITAPASAISATAATLATGLEASLPGQGVFFQVENYNIAVSQEKNAARYEIQQQLLALNLLLKDEPQRRLVILQAQEALRQASDAYRSKLNAGLDLMEERAEFNRRAAGDTQEYRYQDMTFRVFRNEALDKYHAAFDLAAKYTWLAAKAYAYETNLPSDHPAAADSVLEDVVKSRVVGDVAGGEPVLGDGLANALAVLRDNYSVLKGQLGLNNAQSEDSKISIRHELLRKKGSSDAEFRSALNAFRVENLNVDPLFLRFCRPFDSVRVSQPGLVIPLPTTITAGKNVFGNPLGPADHAFDPSLFATKVNGVGVWFEGYDLARFAAAPRVYLVPAGDDIMLEPTSLTFEQRRWTIVDQRIPVPHLIGTSPIGLPDWKPATDTLDGLQGEIRKFSSFRAYTGGTGAAVDTSQMSFDSRLVGRSVWNSKWLLIIPGQTLGADPSASLSDFVGSGGITDIRLVFKTFGFSGN